MDGVFRNTRDHAGNCICLYTLEEIEKNPTRLFRAFCDVYYDLVVIVKIETRKLVGKLSFGLDDMKAKAPLLAEDDFFKDTEHFYLHNGYVPMDSIVEITIKHLEKKEQGSL
jgi:hypothetical protein